jgi:nitrate reductase gamma subunit
MAEELKRVTSTRVVFWGIPEDLQTYFYAAAAASVLIFFLGVWSRISIWTTGRDDENFAGFGPLNFIVFAIKNFFSPNCILAKKSFVLASYRGVMLLFIIWGFSTLFIGTVLLTLHHYSVQFLMGNTYLVFSFALDLGGLLLALGLLIAIARRYLVAEVKRVTSAEDLLFLFIFLFIVITGFLVEGVRLAALRPQNMDYSYVGALFSSLVEGVWNDHIIQYKRVWILHTGAVLFLIAYLPFSKFFHIISAQVSVATAEKRYGGVIGGR